MPEEVPSPRRGGRPSKEEAGKLEDKILDAAAALFFGEGYGAASIEQIAKNAQISKRTFYARFENKAALFSAVVRRVIQRVRPADGAATDKLFLGDNIEEILRRIAPVILHGALSPEAVALHRVVQAEAARFPELALIVDKQGARQEAIKRIAALLRDEAIREKRALADPVFAAEHFLLMLTAGPQRRAMGLGVPMTSPELHEWAMKTVDLFLNGYRGRD